MSKPLTRRTDDKVIAGVCSGLADYLGIDVTLTRIGMVLLAIFAQVGWIVYIVLWLVMPEQGSGRTGIDGLKDAFGSNGTAKSTYQQYPGPQDNGPQDPPTQP
jgi:phage shock protein C